MKQKTRILIYILIAIAVVILGAIAILSSRTAKPTPESHLDLGRIYIADLSYDKAILEFKEAIRIDPKDPEPYIELANTYIEIDDIPSAIETLETGLKETDDDEIEDMLEELKKSSEEIPGNESESDVTIVPPEKSISIEAASEAGTTVSTVNMVEVPNLSGLSEEEAKKLCEDNGFKYSISYAGSNNIEKGFVIGQTIPAGASVAKGISIPFSVSEGSSIKVELVAENLEFDYLADFEESGWAFAVRGTEGGYVNISGEFVEVYDNVPPLEDEYLVYWAWDSGIGFAEGDGEFVNFESPFKVSDEGIYPYYSGNKWGYANINTGKIIVPCEYDQITMFSCKRGFVGKNTSYLTEYQIVDENGNYVSFNKEITGVPTSGFINNIAILNCYDFGKTMIDTNGNIIVDDIVSPISGGRSSCVKNYAITYQRENNNVYSITPELKISKLFDGKPNEYGYCEVEYPYGFMYGDYSFFSDRSDYITGIIDINGNILCDNLKLTSYNYVYNQWKKCFVQDENGYYLMDIYGKKLSNSVYEQGAYAKDFSAVQKNGKWGFIDDNDNKIIDFIFDDYHKTQFINEKPICAIVYINDKGTCLIDTSGNVLHQFNGTFEYLADLDNANYVVTKNNNKYSIYKISD